MRLWETGKRVVRSSAKFDIRRSQLLQNCNLWSQRIVNNVEDRTVSAHQYPKAVRALHSGIQMATNALVSKLAKAHKKRICGNAHNIVIAST